MLAASVASADSEVYANLGSPGMEWDDWGGGRHRRNRRHRRDRAKSEGPHHWL